MKTIFKMLLWTGGGIAFGHLAGRALGKTEEEKERFARNGRMIGGLAGFGVSLAIPTKDCVNYTQMHKGKRVYEGITTLDRKQIRQAEHRRNGKQFDEVRFSQPKTREEALTLEKVRIQRLKPKNNIQHNCD